MEDFRAWDLNLQDIRKSRHLSDYVSLLFRLTKVASSFARKRHYSQFHVRTVGQTWFISERDITLPTKAGSFLRTCGRVSIPDHFLGMAGRTSRATLSTTLIQADMMAIPEIHLRNV